MPAPLAVDKEVGALDNPRWEDFAKHIVAGETQTRAYELAFGMSTDSARQSASQLIRHPLVSARVATLRKFGLGSSPILTLAAKRAFCQAAVETPVGKVNENSPLCQSYKVRRDKEGNETVEYEMVNKLKALELDAKLAGELNGSQQSVRISMFGQAPVIDIEATVVEREAISEGKPLANTEES